MAAMLAPATRGFSADPAGPAAGLAERNHGTLVLADGVGGPAAAHFVLRLPAAGS